MSTLRFTLFGKFHVDKETGAVAGFEARKNQELLCYLLLYRNRPHPRETLASLLWDSYGTLRSKKYLRQALWQLQLAVDAAGCPASCPLLLVDQEWVCFNDQAQVWIDVAEFERAWIAVRGVPGVQLSTAQAKALSAAVELYSADLLEGWYHDWCLFERERLQNCWLAALEKLMNYCEAHGLYEAGLAYGEQVLRCDRARERTHRRMMRLYCQAGNRTAALRQYEQLVQTLREELDVGPSRRSRELWELIRTDTLPVAPLASYWQDGEAAAVAESASPGILGHLRILSAMLGTMQLWVREEIEAMELSLGDS